MRHSNWLGKLFLAAILIAAGLIACEMSGENVVDRESTNEPDVSWNGSLNQNEVSVQLYSIRSLVEGGNYQGDYNYIKALLQEVYDVGYRYVEPANNWGLTPEVWVSILEETGLKVSSLHHGVLPGPGYSGGNGLATVNGVQRALTLEEMKGDIDILETYLKAFDLDFSIINYAGWTTAQQWNLFLEALDTYIAELHRRGIKVGFHSHNHEFGQYEGASNQVMPANVWDQLYPKLDLIEIDLHWAARAGINPVDAIKKYQPKTEHLHMKDISIVSRNGNDIPTRFEEIGMGTLDWPEIIKIGKSAGSNVKFFTVEQDANHLPDRHPLYGNAQGIPDFSDAGPIRSIRQSLANLASYRIAADLSLPSEKIRPEQLSIQLYNFRYLVFQQIPDTDPVQYKYDHRGDKAWIRTNILQKLADIGYKNVELYNNWGLTGDEWKEILDAAGLRVSSIHQNIIDGQSVAAAAAINNRTVTAELDYQINNLVTFLGKLPASDGDGGLKHIFVASGDFINYAQSNAYLLRLDRFRKTLAAKGITVNYHTHSQEFAQPDHAKEQPIDNIIRTGAQIELDTHWAKRAGVNPVTFMLQHPNNINYLHIKDISFGFSKPEKTSSDQEMIYHYEEIGDGTTNWEDIFKTANYIGVKYFVVEQDANYWNGNTYNAGNNDAGDGLFYAQGDPLESARRSYAYIANKFF
jgi:sugar phosphate isomerase/epimerase